MYLLMDRSPASYLNITYYIQNLLSELYGIVDIKIQYIPEHKDIPGNESADQAATAAHSHTVAMNAAISREDKVRTVKSNFVNCWKMHELVMLESRGRVGV